MTSYSLSDADVIVCPILVSVSHIGF